MAQLVVLEGFLEIQGDSASLLTLDGVTLTLERRSIVRSAQLDTSKEPLMRVFLDPESEVRLSFKLKELVSGGQSPMGTILKWLDDGGTISKSRDDNMHSGSSTLKWVDDGGTISKSRDDS